MNRSIIVLTGFLLISAGLMTAAYQTLFQKDMYAQEGILEKILEGEEYLQQTGDTSKSKAVSIFSELVAKNNPQYEFRIRYNLAKALENSGDKYRALEIYQSINRTKDISITEQEKLSLSLGDLLLRMNRENEGRVHLDNVLRTSTDRKIRSKVFKSLAEYNYNLSQWEIARKNYILAIQEDGNYTEARIGLGRVLKKQGKDYAAFDLFDGYLEESSKMDGTDPNVAKEYKTGVYEKAKTYFVNKSYYKAIEYFQKSIELGQNEEGSLYYIASSYDALGKYTEAIKTINKLLNNSVYSLDQEALFKKGTIYFKQGKYENAASIFQVVIEKYAKNHITEKSIAWKKESLDQIQEKTNLSTTNTDSNQFDAKNDEDFDF
ncbi:MAG: tetratricopeptide repeat protein [Leptospira sp.]|nr:tetratricopeptide repeat protein [Leptospira sp.]NCS93364.1 tetratricopeptide repeat protein [Leptospira sp.]